MFFGNMFIGMPAVQSEHRYSLCVSGLGRVKTYEFTSRHMANEKMYAICKKHGLKIVKIYDDKHDKAYFCDNGVRFNINRW